MATIAIVGAGPRLGRSIARTFGRQGYAVALVSRRQAVLDEVAAELGAEGIEAAGFAADVTDAPAMARAVAGALDRFGTIDVLEYSPAPPSNDGWIVPAAHVTVDQMQATLDFVLLGAVTATRLVLPGMLERGHGTLLYSSGASALHPIARLGNFGAAAAALRHWVLMLNRSLGPQGVYAAHVPIGVFIGDGQPDHEPDVIAETYWRLHTERTEAEHLYGTPPTDVLERQ
jgi:NADP-dependent 3-hydroxy acid dehydrogenase YdfG